MAGTSSPLAPSAPTASPGSHDEHHQGVDHTPLPAHNDLSYSAPLPAMARQSRFLPPLAKQRKEQAKDKAQQRRALPQPSPQAEQPYPLAPPEGAEDGIAAIAEASVAAVCLQKVSSSAAKRKESGVQEQKEQQAKRFKLPTRPVSPLVPTRSTGIRMMLSPRLDPPSTSGTIDIAHPMMQLMLVIMRMMKQRKLLLQGLQKNSDPSVGKSLIQFLSMELLCRQDANIVMNC